MIVSLILALASAGYEIYSGYTQQQNAHDAASNVPKISVPQSAYDAVAGAANAAKAEAPGITNAKRNIEESGATAMYNIERGANSSQQVIAAANAVNANKNKAFRNLGAQEDQYKAAQENRYLNMLMRLSGMELNVNNENAINSYNVMAAEKEVGRAQMSKGIEGALAAGATYAGAYDPGARHPKNKPVNELEPKTASITSIVPDKLSQPPAPGYTGFLETKPSGIPDWASPMIGNETGYIGSMPDLKIDDILNQLNNQNANLLT